MTGRYTAKRIIRMVNLRLDDHLWHAAHGWGHIAPPVIHAVRDAHGAMSRPASMALGPKEVYACALCIVAARMTGRRIDLRC